MNSIEVRNATKTYDTKNLVLNGLNLTVKSGSIYGLIGASGCGKTTLLSCMLGMKQLDGGTIKMLGKEISYKTPSKFPHLIGYMPQETALVPELTINEILNYFGNIFQMNQVLLKQRLVMICDLLELRNKNKRIQNLSGGEKRRVSFAAALIHNPRVLILDEPTVGLDSILREKIWNFLIDSTRSSDMSVIITTHYIAEAEKSNCCGLMRHGMLLVEDSPQNIYKSLHVSNLEEAFYKLCVSESSKVSRGFENVNNLQIPSSSEQYLADIKENESNNFDKREKFSRQTLKALFTKEIIRIRRQPGEMVFTFLLAIIQTLCFAFAMGRHPIGLQLGVVNNEVTDSNFCLKYLKQTNYEFNSTSCYFEHLSCFFLNEIKDETAIMVYKNSFDEAYNDARVGKTYGFLTITSNFTDVMSERKNDWQYITEYTNFTDANLIQIYMDQTDYTISTFLQIRLLKAFERFNKKLLQQCDLNDKLEDSPLEFSPFYGALEDDFVVTFMSSMFSQLSLKILLLCGILFSISCIAQSRIEGVWNRTILAGVTTNEILAVQFFILTISDIIQVLIFKIMVDLLFDQKIVGNGWLVGAACLGIYMIGSSMGLYISILTKNLYIVNSAGILIFFVCAFLCGGMWPLEAQPEYLRYFAVILPTTVPSTTMRNILAKGFSISHYTIYGGFFVIIAYIIVFLTLSFLTLRRKKYSY